MIKNIQPMLKLSSGYLMPQIGLGLYKLERDNQDKLTNLLQASLDIGYKHFDGARLYQNEKEVGNSFKEIFSKNKYKREDLFITTKGFSNKQVSLVKILQDALDDLQMQYVDLYLIHWPSSKHDENLQFNHKPTYQAWAEMEQCVELGLAKSIGLSNFNVQMMVDILTYCKIKPVVNQVEQHILLQQIELTNFCHKFDIQVTAYCPLMRGGDYLNNPTLIDISNKYNKTVSQIILNYLVKILNVSVIPKTQNIERLQQNFDFYDFDITEDDKLVLQKMDQNFRLVDPSQREFLGFNPLFK